MTPEQISRAKSIVQFAAVESQETEEIMLLGWAIQEIDHLRAELARFQSPAPVGGGVPELTEEDIKRCLRSTGLREDEDGPANTYYRDGLEDGYALAASRLPALKTGEVAVDREALDVALRAQATTETTTKKDENGN